VPVHTRQTCQIRCRSVLRSNSFSRVLHYTTVHYTALYCKTHLSLFIMKTVSDIDNRLQSTVYRPVYRGGAAVVATIFQLRQVHGGSGAGVSISISVSISIRVRGIGSRVSGNKCGHVHSQ
jgi:hypothetical protein